MNVKSVWPKNCLKSYSNLLHQICWLNKLINLFHLAITCLSKYTFNLYKTEVMAHIITLILPPNFFN